VAAGLAMLRLIETEQPYAGIAFLTRGLADGLDAAARSRDAAFRCASLGSMFTPFFTAREVTDLATAKTCDTAAHAAFFRGMLARGFYLPPSQFEVGFVSAAHTETDIREFTAAAARVMAAL